MSKITPIEITFLGDISLNNRYENETSLRKRAFKEIEPILHDSDYVVGNLECFCKGEHINAAKKPRIQTSGDALECLKDLNISLVSLANNHVYDNLEDGFSKTCEKLAELNINYLGASLTAENASKAFYVEIKNKQFCFLNYVTSDTNPRIPKDAGLEINEYDKSRVVEDILVNKSKVDFVVLLLHWGGDVEGHDYPLYSQRTDAKEFIAAGADVIIGHHSHTWQPMERIDGKPVFYSLGNFCFDNIECEGKLYYMSSFKSNLVKLSFDENGISVKLYPFKSDKRCLKLTNQTTGKISRTLQFLWMYVVHRSPLLDKYTRKILMPIKRLVNNKDLSFNEKVLRSVKKFI